MRVALAGPCTVAGLSRELPDYADLDHPSDLVRSLVDGYVAKGHQVHVVKFNRHADAVEFYAGNPVGISVIPRRNRAIELTPTQWGRERSLAANALAKIKPDVIHAHWTYEYARAALQTGIPTVVTAHDVPSRLFTLMRPRYYWWPRLLQGYLVARQALRMTAQSPYTLECWKSEMFRRKPIDLVPNPIAPEIFDLAKTPSKRHPSISFMACPVGFHPRKNTKNLIIAFTNFRKSNSEATLTLFGDDHGPAGPAYQWAEQNELSMSIEFRGQTDRFKMLEEMANRCDVFVHPAREESFGMVVAEAMALGIPVVGGQHAGAVPWLLDNGRAGFLCDVESPSSIADAMELATKDNSVGPIGRQRIIDHCSLDTVVNHYLQILFEESHR